MTTIDVHTHYVPKGWPELSETPEESHRLPRLRVDSEREAMILLGDRDFRRIGAECWDAEVRLADMDADGVDIQVVSPTPVFFSYGESPRTATRISRIFNDLALEICEPAGGRLLPFAQVPLQDADAACEELDRCLENGHVGVEIGNHIGDADLDHGKVVQFLQHCAERGAPVFVHPWDMPSSPRLDRWMAQWLVGMPSETHLSILAMILGGTFDKVSGDLRIAFAHGGGSFAFWLGRVENAWYKRADVIATSAKPPSHYLDRFYVDSVVFDPSALATLTSVLGTDRVLLGSDYPYPLGERPVGQVVRDADFLSPDEQAALLGGNAARFLGLRAEQLAMSGTSGTPDGEARRALEPSGADGH